MITQNSTKTPQMCLLRLKSHRCKIKAGGTEYWDVPKQKFANSVRLIGNDMLSDITGEK